MYPGHMSSPAQDDAVESHRELRDETAKGPFTDDHAPAIGAVPGCLADEAGAQAPSGGDSDRIFPRGV